jgi:hypothetical protein
MKTRYLTFFLIFILLAAVFTFLRNPISEGINAILIAVGEGRSIRVDNTDMVKRKTEKQVKVQGGARISQAAQVRILPDKVSAPPVTRLAEGKFNPKKRKVMFIPDWAVLGVFDLKAIAKQLRLATVLAQECMNDEAANVSFQMVPKGFQWQHIRILSNDGKINLTETFRKNRAAAAAWLAAEIEVDKDYPDARMFVGIQQYGRVFLNGKQVFVSTAKTPARSDGSNVPVQLKKGRNLIIVKTACTNYRSWNVFLRFATAKKIPLMPPLKQTPAKVPVPAKAPAQKPQK